MSSLEAPFAALGDGSVVPATQDDVAGTGGAGGARGELDAARAPASTPDMGKFLDAALNGAATYAGKAYFFKGTKYVRYDWAKEQGDPDYPMGLDEWGFPPPFDKGIDAAIEGREAYEKKAFFFKDDKYLRYDWTSDKIDSGYPKSIDGWGLPAGFFAGKKKIDAAVNGAGESARYCYLFSGTNWVRIDWKEEEEPVLHKGGVQGDWDLPAEIAKGIDAALSGWGKKYESKAYFFKDQKYARYDWSADKCDSKNGDFGAWKMSWDDASPGQQKGPTGAPSDTPTDAPTDQVPQPWNGLTGKVWVPSSASGKLGLVVYLHGNSKMPKLWGAGRMLADAATLAEDDASMNLGNLAGQMIADRKIKPIAVAAPSDRYADLAGSNLWKSLDFSAFVDEVFKKVRGQYKMDIDLDQVAVVGWSGAGVWLNCGIDKVAHQGGKFTAGGSSHTLALIGLADTWVDGGYSKSIKNALAAAGNTTTMVYAVYKGTGGHKAGGDANYATGFSATRDLKGKQLPSSAEDADRDAFEFYMDDGKDDSPPTRTAAKVVLGGKGVNRHWSYFIGANATANKPTRNDHCRMPLVWSWYGLQRYFPK